MKKTFTFENKKQATKFANSLADYGTRFTNTLEPPTVTVDMSYNPHGRLTDGSLEQWLEHAKKKPRAPKKKEQPKAKRTKFFTAYTDGKPTFKKRKESGVYLIYNKDKKLLYVGYSGSDLYKALYRHFTSWSDRRQKRFTYPQDYLVRIILTTKQRAHLLEKFLITRLSPEDALMKYNDYLTDKQQETVKQVAETLAPVTPDEWNDMSDVPF